MSRDLFHFVVKRVICFTQRFAVWEMLIMEKNQSRIEFDAQTQLIFSNSLEMWFQMCWLPCFSSGSSGQKVHMYMWLNTLKLPFVRQLLSLIVRSDTRKVESYNSESRKLWLFVLHLGKKFPASAWWKSQSWSALAWLHHWNVLLKLKHFELHWMLHPWLFAGAELFFASSNDFVCTS